MENLVVTENELHSNGGEVTVLDVVVQMNDGRFSRFFFRVGLTNSNNPFAVITSVDKKPAMVIGRILK